MTSPERLLVRRESDRSFTLLGTVLGQSGPNVTIRTADGTSQTLPHKSLMFLQVGSLHYFRNLFPERLAEALASAPAAVFEQVLVDSSGPSQK